MRYGHCNIQAPGFETSRDFAVRRLTALWMEALGSMTRYSPQILICNVITNTTKLGIYYSCRHTAAIHGIWSLHAKCQSVEKAILHRKTVPETVDVKFKGFDTMIDILLTIFWNAVFERKVMFFGEMFTEICSFGSNLQRISIGSVNGDLKHFISPPSAKWPPSRTRHFQVYILEWNCKNFDSNFTEIYS